MYLTLIRIRKKELAVSFRCTLTREKKLIRFTQEISLLQ